MTLTLTKRELVLGWVYLLLQMLVLPFAVTLVCVAVGIRSVTTINVICFILNALLALILFRNLLQQSLRNRRGRWKETALTALKGLGLYWLVNIAITWLTLLVEPDFGNVNDASISSMLGESPLLMTFCVIFAAPLAEECLFRGWLFTGLAKKSIPLAYAVTCCFFSAAHVLGYIGSYDPLTLVLCFVQYLGPSFVLCRTCQKDDSLCAPLLMHMAVNALGCILLR